MRKYEDENEKRGKGLRMKLWPPSRPWKEERCQDRQWRKVNCVLFVGWWGEGWEGKAEKGQKATEEGTNCFLNKNLGSQRYSRRLQRKEEEQPNVNTFVSSILKIPAHWKIWICWEAVISSHLEGTPRKECSEAQAYTLFLYYVTIFTFKWILQLFAMEIKAL